MLQKKGIILHNIMSSISVFAMVKISQLQIGEN